jgi:hypothetical protein
MNYRNATLMQRHRKNVQFEQERVASLDYDAQRWGAVKHTKAAKKSEDKPKAKKAVH